MRQVALDTETTGLEPARGHRIIELACVEIIDRKITGNNYHAYFDPGREVDLSAAEVHGITYDMLAGKPRFSECVKDILAFIEGAEVIIHNAPFDVGFINHEFRITRQKLKPFKNYCDIVDTLVMARQLFPGQKNSLDALCKRHYIDNTNRVLHGALLDAELLAQVYLAMTGGQGKLELVSQSQTRHNAKSKKIASNKEALPTRDSPVIKATAEEFAAHQRRLHNIAAMIHSETLWQKCDNAE